MDKINLQDVYLGDSGPCKYILKHPVDGEYYDAKTGSWNLTDRNVAIERSDITLSRALHIKAVMQFGGCPRADEIEIIPIKK